MSNILEYIEQNPQESKRLIGLEYEQLQQLIEQAQLLQKQKISEIEKGKIRIIKGGGGRKAKLSINEQIILTLVYLDHQAYIGEPRIETPHKKRKHQELSAEEKEENRVKATQRIFVEHVIRLVKIFRVAQERFRLRIENYQKIMLTICGLVRLRIGALCLQ